VLQSPPKSFSKSRETLKGTPPFATYEAPVSDAAKDEELKDYIALRKREILETWY